VHELYLFGMMGYGLWFVVFGFLVGGWSADFSVGVSEFVKMWAT
jgi:hypothetical protein